MSQDKVYQGLQEIGGEGTTTELREYLSDRFPNSTLPDYVTNRLRKLEDKNVVEINDHSRPYHAKIIDNEWNGINNNLAKRDFPPESSDDK